MIATDLLQGSFAGRPAEACQPKDSASSFLPDYETMFRCSPVSIWQEDFSEFKRHIDNLKRNGIGDLRKYIERHPEEVLSFPRMIRIVRVNDATLTLYQAGSAQELCESLDLVFNKESYDAFKAEIIALSEGETRFTCKAITKTLRGEVRHILLNVVVAPGCEHSLSCVFVYITDISELRQVEEELRECEEKYRTILESAHDAILVADAETGIILEANGSAEQLIGVPVDRIIGMHFTELHQKEDSNHYRELFLKHIESQSGRLVSEDVVMRRMNGEKVPVSISSSVMWLKGRKCVSAIIRETGNGKASGLRIPDSRMARALSQISQREQEIVRQVALGLSNRQISEKLFISVKTVETHRARIMTKLGLHKAAEVVRFAAYAGLIEEEPPQR